jgi:hypothetical protein
LWDKQIVKMMENNLKRFPGYCRKDEKLDRSVWPSRKTIPTLPIGGWPAFENSNFFNLHE